MQAEHGRLSDPGQYKALRHVITHSPWDAARVWTQLRTVVPHRTGVLAIDDTGFPKQRMQSAGVQRQWQYCGALGKVGTCQVAVSRALTADGRTWPVAFDLYVPAWWTDDAARCAAAGMASDEALSRAVAHRPGPGPHRGESGLPAHRRGGRRRLRQQCRVRCGTGAARARVRRCDPWRRDVHARRRPRHPHRHGLAVSAPKAAWTSKMAEQCWPATPCACPPEP